LLGSIIGAAVHIVDKTALEHYVKTYVSYLLIIAIFQGLVGVSIIASLVWTENLNIYSCTMAVLSGSVFGFSGVLFLRTLNTQEVSRTVPVIQTAPVFAALLGLVFLGEHLNEIQWLAILITAAGALLLSVKKSNGNNLTLDGSLLILILASFTQALARVIGKTPLEDLSIPMTHGFQSLGLSSVMFIASGFNKAARNDVIKMWQYHKSRLAFIATSEIGFVTASFLLFLWAISSSPVGLVTAVYATRSLFLLIYSTSLSLIIGDILGEDITLKSITLKVISVILIVFGVILISVG
jgi:uncharacterized membrane protein